MSDGRDARHGFYFSDLPVIRRVLESLVATRAAEIDGNPAPPPLQFMVESAFPAGHAPTWDIVEQSATSDSTIVVFEEVKSGPLDAEDRRTLWKRIRRTFLTNRKDDHSEFHCRLTTNPEKPTTNPEAWRELASMSSDARGVTLPSRFMSAADLAEEAIFLLTHDAEDETAPCLSLDDARQILRNFAFDDSRGEGQLEKEINDSLAMLAKGLALDSLRRAMLGDLYEKAAKPELRNLMFTSEDLWRKCSELDRLSYVSSDAAEVWRLWRRRPSLADPTANAEEKGLSYRDWARVQPRVVSAIANGLPPRLALVGAGGLGKTVLMSRVLGAELERGSLVVAITGFDLRQRPADIVRKALAVAAFSAWAEKRKVVFAIDAFEEASDSTSELQSYLTALVGDDQRLQILLTVRPGKWREFAGTQEVDPRWRVVELQEWSAEIVGQLVPSGMSVGADLLSLLGTPLLLDIFLRTFADNDVPSGLPTRDGVLSAYWGRRIIRTGHPTSVDREVLLQRICCAEAEGVSRHLETDPLMRDLASEGLFLVKDGGYTFRHPLLRDFALMRWLLADSSRTRAADRLGRIHSRVTRWGAPRALIEAAVATTRDSTLCPTLEDIISAIGCGESQEALSAAEVLGELENPASVDVGRLLDGISGQDRAAEFLHRLLVSAKLATNGGWLSWLVSLPAGHYWIDSTPWIYEEFIRDVMNLCDAICPEGGLCAKPEAIAHVAHLAASTRNWSRSSKFASVLSKYDGHIWHRLMPFVAEHSPTARTLDWLADNVGWTWRSQFGTLEALPLLVVGAKKHGQTLNGENLVAVYCRAGDWVRTPEGIRDSEEHHIVDEMRKRTLIHLLVEVPEHFMAIAFDIVSALAAEQERRRREQIVAILPALELLVTKEQSSPESSEVERIECELRAQYPVEDGSPQALVDDVGHGSYFGLDETRRMILNQVHSMAMQDLEAGGELISTVYWPTAMARRSLVPWVLLLDVLTGHPGTMCDLVDEMLCRGHLYKFASTHSYLRRALKQRWSSLRPEQKSVVIANIEGTAGCSTANGIYGVAPLLTAIPPGERPARLNSFFALWAARHVDPEPPETDAVDDQFERSSATSLDVSDETPWGHLENWLTLPARGDDGLFLGAVRNLKAAVVGGLPDASETRPLWTLEPILREMRRHRSSAAGLPREIDLSTDEMGTVFGWGLGVLQANATNVPQTADGVNLKQTSLGDAAPWHLAVELLSETLMHPTLDAISSYASAFFTEVEALTRSRSPKAIWHMLGAVHEYNWLKPGGAGRLLLQSLLDSLRDGAAMTAGFSLACHLGAEYRLDFFRRCLLSKEVTVLSESMDEFLRLAGLFLGECAFVRVDGAPNNLRIFLEELLAAKPTDGILSKVNEYVSWVEGVVFGAKEAIQREATVFDAVNDYGNLVFTIWRTLERQEAAIVDRGLFCIILHPVDLAAKAGDGERARALWRSVEKTVVRALEGAERGHVDTIVFELRDYSKQLGAQLLMPAVEILHARTKAITDAELSATPSTGNSWLSVLAYAADLLVGIAGAADCDSGVHDRIFELLHVWGRRGCSHAVEVARQIRHVV